MRVVQHHRQGCRGSRSHSGPGGGDGERSTEFCNPTIHTHSWMIVADATHASRLALNSSVTADPQVRFYAGYLIEAPDGQRIGALCVYDAHPRSPHGREETLLHGLAKKIEGELWASPTRRTKISR